MSSTPSDSSSRRTLGLGLGIAVILGEVVGDAGIIVTPGAAVEQAGSGLLLAMLIAGAVALATGTSGAQLGAAIPVSGGGFTWARHFGYTGLSAAAGLAFLGKQIVVGSVEALLLATFARTIFPELPLHTTAAAVVLVATALNYMGVSPTAKVAAVLVGMFIIILIAFVVLAFPAVDLSNLKPILGTGPLGLLQGAGLMFFAFAGFERVAVIASTVRKPQRTVPLAIYTAFPISFVLFMLVAGVTLGVLGTSAMGANEKAPYDAFVQIIGRDWGWLLAVGVILGTMSALGSSILGISQLAREMAAQRELPSSLAQLRGKAGTPRNAVLAVGLIIAAITWSFNLRPLIDVGSAFALIWYGIVNFFATRLGTERRFAWRGISWFGLCGCVILLFTLAWWAITLAVVLLALYLALRHFARDQHPTEKPSED